MGSTIFLQMPMIKTRYVLECKVYISLYSSIYDMDKSYLFALGKNKNSLVNNIPKLPKRLSQIDIFYY